MIFVSGVLETGFKNIIELIGVFLALGAALLYAGVIIINKKTPNIGAYEKTVIQLSFAGITVLPYSLYFEKINFNLLNSKTILLILIICLVHTGVAYALYFTSLKSVKAQTAAIYSYIDPIVAIFLSVLLLKEKMSVLAFIGSITILCATFISEIDIKKARSK